MPRVCLSECMDNLELVGSLQSFVVVVARAIL
jgi:hypothetical protein